MLPEPTPSVKRPAVSSLSVAAAVAMAGAVQSGTGTTEMPVANPPGSTSPLAPHHWAHTWNASWPTPEGVQQLS